MSDRDAFDCADVTEHAPEFALGLLDGHTRAAVVTHLDGCDSCRTDVGAFVTTVDAVLAAAPGADPAPGFEQRVLARLVPNGDAAVVPLRPRRRRLLSLAAAAVVALFAAFGAVTVERAVRTETPEALRHGALVDTRGRAAGDVFVYGGQSAWMFMRVALPSGGRDYSCELVLDDGRTVLVGSFHANGSWGEWGASLNAGTAHVVSARVRGWGGDIVAEAKLA